MDSAGIQIERQQLLELFDILVPEPGIVQSALDGVRIYRINESSPRQPQAYGPRIVILAQGQKRIFLGDKTFVQDASNYLILSVPLPVECEMTASIAEPMLGMSISVSPESVFEILLECEERETRADAVPEGICSALLKQEIIDSAIRLLRAHRSPRDLRLLGPMILKVLIYHVSYGDEGESLRAGQYLKNVRLQKARALMTDGLNVISAAQRVGYESASQFSREYKRYFGITPAKHAIEGEVAAARSA